MRKFSKLMLVVLIVSFLVSSVSTFAASGSVKKIDSVAKKYNLIEVTSYKIPKNKKPLVIKDSVQMDKVFSKLSKPVGRVVKQPSFGIQPRAIGSEVASEYLFTPYAYYNVRVGYEYLWSSTLKKNYYSKITAYSSDITGITAWVDYVHDSAFSYAYIRKDTTSLKVYCEGTATYYLLVSGLMKVYSKRMGAGYIFSNP